jgi:hypothetical protein
MHRTPRPVRDARARRRGLLAATVAALGIVGLSIGALPLRGASPEVTACAAVDAFYPMLANTSSTASFFPSIPFTSGNGSNGTGSAGNGTGSVANGSGGSPGLPTGVPPPIPFPNLTDGQVAQWFDQVCVLPTFADLLASHGVENFTLGAGGNFLSGTVNVTFGFEWAAACPTGTSLPADSECAWQEYWSANATSGTISGPFTDTSPAVYHGASSAPPAPPSSPPAPSNAGGWIAAGILWTLGAAVVAGAVLWERTRRPPGAPGTG